MRWSALGVDYEMSGKDLIDSVKLSAKICRALGGTPPEGFNYELFLDEKGEKISKSKGNGLTIDEWLTLRARRRACRCSCIQKPKAAKRLYFDVIPRTVDEYLQFLAAYRAPGRRRQRLDNPVWHIHRGDAAGGRPADHLRAAAEPGRRLERARTRRRCGASSAASAGRDAADASVLDRARRLRAPLLPRLREADEEVPRPSEVERAALDDLRERLSQLPADARAERSRTSSTMSAGASRSTTRRRRPRTASPASRSTGSTCSTRCCSARRRARASAPSSRSTALQNTVDMIDGALARSA